MLYKSKFLTFHLFLMIFLNFSSIYSQWIRQPFPTTEFLWQVDFCTEDTGWVAANDSIYKTEDAGYSWVAQTPTFGYTTALYVLNSSTAFLSTYNDIGLKMTVDGGLNWNKIDNAPYHYFEFDFVNDQIGFAGCYHDTDKAVFRRTFDGGYNWETVNYNFAPSNFEISGISFIDENNGWVVTYDSYVFYTQDGGDNWIFQGRIGYDSSYSVYKPIRDVDFVSADSGWAVGGLSSRMAVVRTINGGDTWIDSVNWGNSLREVQFVNNLVGWFAGFGYSPIIGKSVDGGLTWEEQVLDPPQAGFESICMINEQIGWAAGSSLYFTNNGGVSDLGERNELKLTQFNLEQNYPNPFNPATTIEYNIASKTRIEIHIYNSLGQRIATLLNKEIDAGTYKTNWNGVDPNGNRLSSGVYYYQMLTESGFSNTKKLLLLK